MTLSVLVHSPYFHGALTGWLSAAATDFHAFKAMQTFKDVQEYKWSVALFRWVQGAIVGLIAAAGLSALPL